MRRPKRVIITTHGQAQYGHDTALGILRFAANHGHWDTLLELSGPHPNCFKSFQVGIRQWKADAIVGELLHPFFLGEIRRSGIPAVNVSSQNVTKLPSVCCNHELIGRMAVGCFLERHYRSFAFCGRQSCHYSLLQETAFRKGLADAGFSCEAYPRPQSHARHWMEEYNEICRWLDGLRRPVAVLACDDIRGRDVLRACEHMRLPVPDEVAVLGSTNDVLLCSTCQPPLATIAIPGEEIGFQAAQLLERLMAGKKPPRGPILVDPAGIIHRRSADALAVDDADLTAAIRFIRDHASQPFAIDDLLATVPVSRRSLERKFRKVLGRTLQEEIVRGRLQQAENLLTQTDMKVAAVGQAAGFSNYLQFVRCFRRAMGATPSQYRARFSGKVNHALPRLPR